MILIPGRWDRVPVCQAFELQGSSYVNVPFPFGDSPTVAVAFSPTGKLVATADPAGVLRIWTWEDNTAVQVNGASKPVQLTSTRSRPFSLVFSPIKDELLVTYMGSSGRMQVEVIDITTNKVRELEPPSARDQFLRFYFGPSNVTRPLLVTALYGRMVLNDVAAIDLARPVAEPIMVVGNSGIPVFSSDGRKLLTLSGAVWLALDTVQLWDLRLPATPQNNAFQYDGQPAPDWLPNLARAVSGIPRAFDDDREPSPTLESVGAAIRSDTVAPAYAGLVHRFFPELRLND